MLARMSSNTDPMEGLAEQASLRGEELTDEVKHLAHPPILEELAQITSLEAQIDALREKREALGDEAEAHRNEIRRRFREQNAKRFEDVDWKRALCGMPNVRHRVTFAGVAAYYLEQPTAQVEHAVRKFVVEKAGKQDLAPVIPEEQMLLAWLVGLEYLGDNPTQPKLATDMDKKLHQIRALSAPMLIRLADECRNMATYLSVVLEEELGNS